MTADIPLPLDLFERFRPRFEAVTVEPTGELGFRGWPEQLKFKLGRAQGFGYSYGKRLDYFGEVKILLAESGLRCSMNLDFSRSLTLQLFHRAVFEVQEQLFKGRVFRIRPESPFTELSHQASSHRKAVLDIEGARVPGLVFEGGGNWTHFVPPGTPEHEAIEAAIKFHEQSESSASELKSLAGTAAEALLATA